MNKKSIVVNNLSKTYQIYKHPRDRLLQAIWGRNRFGKPKIRYEEFKALKPISFNVPKGHTMGIIGRNGSGKSTLLQLICGTLTPTTGTITTEGRIAALLELGSGFNPEFTGIENIYLNASLLGLTQRETDEKLDKILRFAEIGEFVNQPVKTYSSGMCIRLAFAVQAQVEPDILIVDEALAVGDEVFQKKCYSYIEMLKQNGTSILLVTHSIHQILNHCDSALLLNKGNLIKLGKTKHVTNYYQRLLNSTDEDWEIYLKGKNQEENQGRTKKSNDNQIQEIIKTKNNIESNYWYTEKLTPKSTVEYPAKKAKIVNIISTVFDSDQHEDIVANNIAMGYNFKIKIKYHSFEEVYKVAMACTISNTEGKRIYGQCYPEKASAEPTAFIEKMSSNKEWEIVFSFTGSLWPGLYFISCGLLSYETDAGGEYLHRIVDAYALRIFSNDKYVEIGNCYLKNEDATLTIESD